MGSDVRLVSDDLSVFHACTLPEDSGGRAVTSIQKHTMHLHLHIDANDAGEAILRSLLATAEMRERLAERLQEHMAAALGDAVFDTLPALLLACQAALYEVEQGRGNTIGPLLTAAIARATQGRGMA
jgi:hypothetical protein